MNDNRMNISKQIGKKEKRDLKDKPEMNSREIEAKNNIKEHKRISLVLKIGLIPPSLLFPRDFVFNKLSSAKVERSLSPESCNFKLPIFQKIKFTICVVFVPLRPMFLLFSTCPLRTVFHFISFLFIYLLKIVLPIFK